MCLNRDDHDPELEREVLENIQGLQDDAATDLEEIELPEEEEPPLTE